jgi:uncharacterized Ntn-hydrolase superfamily protein
MLPLRALIAAVLMFSAGQAAATFSIVACDRDGNCGVAVATNNLAVGASVPYAQARVGALVSQFETNPSYGPKGLALLAAGVTPEQALQRLLDGDGNFDGGSIAERQVGMVGFGGRSATYTGADAQASPWAGALSGDGYAVQGNGLAGAQVLNAMQRTFAATAGTLAERLMAALEAGESAGGQSSGRMSAALLVRTVDGDWQDIDLRVDASAQPVPDLRALMERHYALQAIARAEHQARKGRKEDARRSMNEALCRSQGWDRIGRRAARLAASIGDPALSAADLSWSPTRPGCGK